MNKIAKSILYYDTKIDSELFSLISKKVNKVSIEMSACVGGSDLEKNVDVNIRKSKVSWFTVENWVTSIFSHYFHVANHYNWEYDLNFLSEIQITKYTPGGFYTWHCDYGVTEEDSDTTRKLSASLLMSDPNTFRGGDLEFINYNGSKQKAPRELGTMTIFDSRIPHRVTQVTNGERISLVAWMLGPKLR